MTLEDAKRSGFDPRDLISSEIVLEAVKPPMLGGPADKKYFMDEFVKSVRDAAGPISKEHRAQKYDAETADVVNRVNVTLGGGSTVKPDHPAALCSACHKVWLHRGETSCWKCGWKRG
jgi:hypothetical protein